MWFLELTIDRFKNLGKHGFPIKFKMKIFKPVHFSVEDTIENITADLNKILEKMILDNPNNWIWSHNRWK